MSEKTNGERLFAFRVTGRYQQVHYVRARTVAEAKARWAEGYTDESDTHEALTCRAKRLPELDEAGPSRDYRAE